MPKFNNIWVYTLHEAAHRHIDCGWIHIAPDIVETTTGSLLIDARLFKFEASARNWIQLTAVPYISYGVKSHESTPGARFDFIIVMLGDKYYLATSEDFGMTTAEYSLCKVARLPRGGTYLIDGSDPSHMYADEVHDVITMVFGSDFGETFRHIES
ncbi:MAG: hypothetical protein UZ21_OP11001000872 [Microgenomates bacterium OLB22]|nr:MAG: hypothetical protein UZ21_OP11001000872 [Microgenomates bacterium OLB22]